MELVELVWFVTIGIYQVLARPQPNEATDFLSSSIGNLGIGGNLTVTGTTTFNGGTITMGDAATDNVVFGADVDSNIIPDDDNTYDTDSTLEYSNPLCIIDK